MGTPVRDERRIGVLKRVRRPGPTTLVVVALAATLLAGSTAAATVPTRGDKQVSVKAWSASACKGLSTWERRLTQLGPGDAADAAAAKAALTTFLSGAARATGRLATTLRRAGVPAVTHGAEIAAAFVSAAKGLRASYVEAGAAASALVTDDPAAALAVQTQIQGAETTLRSAVAEAAAKYPSKKLDRALVATKACNDLG